MEIRHPLRKRLIKLRAQRWSREILMAALLTIAAVVFIAAAMLGKSQDHKPGVETARTPQE